MKRFIKWLLVSLLTFSSFGLLLYVFKFNVLNAKQFILLSMIILLIWFILIFKLIRKKTSKVSKIIFGFLSIIFICLYALGARYVKTTIEYTKKITEAKFETVNYKVLTLSENDYKINDLKNKNIGFMSTDPYLDKSIKKLEKKILFNDKTYEEVGTLIGELYENKVQGIVINESYLSLLDENEVQFINENKELYSYSIKVFKKKNKKTVDVTKDPFIVYISGSDSRGTISDVARSDVNIVTVINPKQRKVLLVSIPRDYYVQLHGTYGVRDKLTHAGVYGIEMSKNTINDLLGININYYVKIGFTAVERLVDTVDGVDIYSDINFTAHTNKNCSFTEGNQHVNGTCALAFARERYSYESGDRHRGQNQQTIITALINKLTNPKYLIRYDKILKNTEGTLETDLSYDDITSLVKYELSDLKKWNVESISLDGTGDMQPTYSMGSINLYVMEPNIDTVNYAKEKINEYLSLE